MSAAAFEATVSFTVDDRACTFQTWSDMSALLAIRLIARHPTPRRGCEAGLCGSCESLVNGQPTRLCQMSSTELDGLVVETVLR
jgi:aerobic-type carbon monoxide dehydrogenase small subunit (CoxS/CutS family)